MCKTFEQSVAEVVGKSITAASLEDNELHLTFSDGKRVAIFDDGQLCCEDRYIKCDDDLSQLVGATFTGVEEKPGPNVADGGYCLEQMFIEVKTSQGSITLNAHNEHNGYYGGFSVAWKELD